MSKAILGRRVVLASHPQGALTEAAFRVEEFDVPECANGSFLVRALYISVDPMLRLFIDPAPLFGGMPPLPEGTLIPGAAVGEVIASRHPDFAVGTIVEGRFGWQTHAVSNGVAVNRVDKALGDPANALGVGGLPGFTAYCGIQAAGGVTAGQTWLVSGAAGAVGSVLGPLVRARGGRLVGIAGGTSKQAYLRDLGYDVTIDRLAPDFAAQLAAALPQGANVYFDNVGGPLLPQVLPHLARGAQILICGLMAGYQQKDAAGPDHLPELLQAVMVRGVTVKGFTQLGQDAQRPAFTAEIAGLLASGALRAELHTVDGFDQLPAAMVNLFNASTTGKVVVRV